LGGKRGSPRRGREGVEGGREGVKGGREGVEGGREGDIPCVGNWLQEVTPVLISVYA